ncbi:MULTISPECIES: MerR family transcriptional regulator [unclassified Duganella]|uniref:MerR family transcriptional regulator n=1 Tax=unclassified Duganella TaxID=2636909 RepID=UPI000884BAB4|nr:MULTISPECIES: MerR family transcriptional regulator [unclassified Duganella]SDG77886.1 MerR HTH family regulatory protein [Duganella sp. OV458]SDK04889.1 MerR HTH family regulatory protein [Duganella sp. OV510]
MKLIKGYRSGVAARLAGLPVETLRVWERRYGVSEADRSPHGQRLYSAEQVHRLGLIKRVVDQGHAIGTVARLDVDELAALAGTPVATGVQALKLAVVGAALAQRLGATRTAPLLEIVAVCPQLQDAAGTLAGASADVLLIEAPEMTADAMPQIQALRRAVPAKAVVVLYRFCDSATVRRLREHGCLVARSPSDASEVAVLCNTALTGTSLPPPGPTQPATPRRLSDEELAALANASTSINCECPRHLADILMILASFERYSAQCANRNAMDAAMHEDLARSAGHARMMMEDALERLAYAEGLPMPVK